MGTSPSNWIHGMHDHDGHSLRSAPSDRSGEEALVVELGALMASQGIEYADDDDDDARNTHLDVKRVREGRTLGMQ